MQGGRIEPDALGYIEHWYMSVVRLGLPAVVFHESLSPEFVEKVQTGEGGPQAAEPVQHSVMCACVILPARVSGLPASMSKASIFAVCDS